MLQMAESVNCRFDLRVITAPLTGTVGVCAPIEMLSVWYPLSLTTREKECCQIAQCQIFRSRSRSNKHLQCVCVSADWQLVATGSGSVTRRR